MYEPSTHDPPEPHRPLISILTDLEHAIRADPPKTPTESGRVHPLTRLVMDQLHHACLQMGPSPTEPNKLNDENDRVLTMVSSVMDLLDSNLESRSRLYKDQALGYIFMMNNRRYILQQVKDSEEMKALMEDTWCRKRSSDLRLYHKEYQRETWGRLLACLNPDGLTSPANGKPVKPVLKERFKSFNSMFDEIHKTQSNWVVSDEQLQSELRVAISNMVVPAYRQVQSNDQSGLTKDKTRS
ncbi:exocyst subunit exo70 family protein C1 [Striga asiatica]|uniref:Exocyst subunit Exo70 family protein n=1 Tax=Striga asiatica TaxID=4170 RepID=A0A5A7P5U1_STRAF|nr:exocyst subunit exo70 family protein C1 [Striga asiatica]